MIITCILGFILGRKLAQNVETKRPKYESAQILLKLQEIMPEGVFLSISRINDDTPGMISDVPFEEMLDFLEMVACFKNDGCLAENHFLVGFGRVFTKLDKSRLERFNGEYSNIKRLMA